MLNSNIKISIITVCYNSELTIRDTIESVLNQTYTNIEYIIVDGKSQDCTLDIVRSYEPLFESRMKIISERDKGIYDAMNKGIKMATGELIGLINSDDYYESNAVEKIVEAYGGERYAVIYGLLRCIEDEKESMICFNSHNFLERRMIMHPSCFVSKYVYDEIMMYNTNYISAADYDFMYKLYKNGSVKFIPIYCIIANCRGGGISTTQKGYLEYLKVRMDLGLMPVSAYWMSVLSLRFKHAIIYILWGRNDKKKDTKKKNDKGIS